MNSLFNSLTITQKRLLVLLWNSLWGKPFDPKIFEGISKQEWKRIMELSAVQGVYAIAFEGVQKLAPDHRPSKDLMIEWGIGIKKIEQRYFQQKQALQNLAAVFKEKGIRCLLIKGIGLSRYYPVPEHRESGDLDIFLFGDYEKGNRLIEEAGIPLEIPKIGCVHANFDFQQVKVENHRSFFALDWQKDDADFEKILQQKLREEPPVYAEDLGVYLPSAGFNLLYSYKHALKHFIFSGIVLRQLCDLAQLMNQNRNPEIYQSFYETMKRFGLHHYVDAFNLLIADVLGLSLDSNFYSEKAYSLGNQILKDIFLTSKNRPDLPRSGFFQLVKVKIYGAADFYKSRWKYQAVNDTLFLRELGLRMKISLLHFKELKNVKSSRIL